jgi:hypothetical protein
MHVDSSARRSSRRSLPWSWCLALLRRGPMRWLATGRIAAIFTTEPTPFHQFSAFSVAQNKVMEVVQPLNIPGATLVVQFCLVIILSLGVTFTPDTSFSIEPRLTKSGSLMLIVVLVLLTTLVIIFTKEFYVVWSAILGDLTLPTFSRAGGLAVVFGVDLVIVWGLMVGTGGAKSSPFTSVLFLIPALAIFLREPPWRFLIYATVAAVMFLHSLTLSPQVRREVASFEGYNQGYPPALREVSGGYRGSSNIPYGIVNLLCLGLAMLTGYITRPISH